MTLFTGNSVIYCNIGTVQNSSVNLKVRDFFNQILFNQTVDISELFEYNIYIDLVEFKIENQAREIANYTFGFGAISTTGNILPNEIIEFHLANNTYTFNFTNQEDNSLHTNTIDLQTDQVLIINTTYYSVYFALFNFDGLGLDDDLVRFYINDARADLGFNELQADSNLLTVKDYFDQTLFNTIVDTSQYTEYNIFVEVWSLIIHNNYSHAVYLEIERNDYEIRQLIPAHSSVLYRFLPNIRYEIRIYDTDNNKIHEEYVKLDENNKIVSFGFYSTEIPVDPTPLLNSMNLLIWFAIFVFFIGIIIAVLYVRFARQKASIPIELKRFIAKKSKSSKNTKKNTFSNKDIYID